jgi:malonyl-ACP decarboxylase
MVSSVAITGIGVVSAIGEGKDAFTDGLLQGRNAFSYMKRPGRRKECGFLGAEISAFTLPERFSKRTLRTASLSVQLALTTLQQAWEDSNLDGVDPLRIGLVVGGSNFQQRELVQSWEAYRDRLPFIRPSYGLTFLDTDVCGACTEEFGIAGLAYTVGGASASGQLAILQAIQAIQTEQVDVCIAIGTLMDLSYLECQALRSLGAMGSDRYSDQPAQACRPFDKNRDGFIFGECSGAIVLEKADAPRRAKVKPYAVIAGWAITMDRNRNPDPSFESEVRVINSALQHAKLAPREIDYVNPHGTGSVVGDETELRAILACKLAGAYINATKSITGHGLAAAGVVEVIATLVQMEASQLHPTRNLDEPIEPRCNWVGQVSISHAIKNAITLSIGFGGINTAICLRQP